MRLENDVLLDYKDVLIRPKRSTLRSRNQVQLERRFKFRNFVPDFPDNIEDYHYRGVPIMASNMDGVGTFEMADKLAEGRIFTCLVKTYSADELIEYFDPVAYIPERTANVAMSIGTSDEDWSKLEIVHAVVKDKLKYVCMDIANGYSDHFAARVRKVRDTYPNIVIIAGNVVTAEMTEELILSGADIVKVGIGPGSVCTTRIQTGVGYPQLSAVIQCADAAHGLGGHIIADGGCSTPGDVAKAFAGGADFVMLGGMLAGHNEGGGEVITKFYQSNELVYEVGSHLSKQTHKVEEKKFVQFYGMSSASANNKHFGGLKEYRSSEGRTILVPYRGEVARTIQDILGGLRSTCTYAGAMKLKQLAKCTTFVRCTQTHNSVYENLTIGN
jgi:GMP reductase